MTLKPPKATKGDAAHAIVKAGLSVIPMIGGPAVELFQYVMQPPLERRRGEWMQEVGERLQELEGTQGINLEKLGQNDEFISAVLHATTIAMRTHKEEKREALRNAVMNVAVGQSPDEALEHMFFEWIDSFSVLHLQVLRAADNPTPPQDMFMGGLIDVLENSLPNIRQSRDVFEQIWKDLYSRSLVDIERLSGTMSGSGLAQRRTTTIGRQFLTFISEPAIY
ncbi:hypothetical protein LCG94_01700 [Aeromonas salmonicida]|uniref:hypothetical protein n=1 Tax=Aeromonas salmonicida TaxID=645 RepID=UPI003BB6AC9B